MRRRLLESLGVAAVLTALVLFLQLWAAGGASAGQAPAAKPPAAQAPTAKAPAGQAPAAKPTGALKTASGDPDLQGIWLDEFNTPIERAPRYADREFFTQEERDAQNKAAAGNAGRNQRAEVGTRQDVAGAYNAVFTSA